MIRSVLVDSCVRGTVPPARALTLPQRRSNAQEMRICLPKPARQEDDSWARDNLPRFFCCHSAYVDLLERWRVILRHTQNSVHLAAHD